MDGEKVVVLMWEEEEEGGGGGRISYKLDLVVCL